MAASIDEKHKDEASDHSTSDRHIPFEAQTTEKKLFVRSNQYSTYDNDSDSDKAFYAPPTSWEGHHRYDPGFEWTPKEEKRLVRKIDLRICSWVCLMFFSLQLDRGNISQALSDNMLDDLHLSDNQYNTGQTIFYLCFLFAELPSQLISKKLGKLDVGD